MTNYQKRKFIINKPHEGLEEFEFDYMCVNFTDGIQRFICKSEVVPRDWWPRSVYILSMISGLYEEVGSYKHKTYDEYNMPYEFIESKC